MTTLLSRRQWLAAAAAAGATGLFGLPAAAREVREITSQRGLKGWLVEERAVPLVALRFGFAGGSTQDPVGKEGLTSILLAMLQEGAGELPAREFKQAVQETSSQLSFSSARDRVTGGILAPTPTLARAGELLRTALLAPRIGEDDLNRVRRQLVARHGLSASDPGQVALDSWYASAYAGHAYARPATGTPESLAAITRPDLLDHRRRLLVRDQLRAVIVGSIDPQQASALLDQVFGDLPQTGALTRVAPIAPARHPRPIVTPRELPAASAVIGLAAPAGTHADYAATLVLNHIMGSGDFDARLVEALRVRRGLVYSIRTSLVSDSTIALMIGQFATRNEVMGEALDVIGYEMRRMAKDGPTAEEVDNAKSQLAGSLLLGYDGNARLADALLGFWLDGHGRDELARRRSLIARVTLQDVARVAAEQLRPEHMTVAIVGQPRLKT